MLQVLFRKWKRGIWRRYGLAGETAFLSQVQLESDKLARRHNTGLNPENKNIVL